MVHRKIKIKRIQNATTRQVTFSKRRGGLLKKAHDLSVLCDVEVGVIIFSDKGKLFQFASPSMECILERYARSCGDSDTSENIGSSDNGEDADRLTQFTEKLKILQSNLIGDDLERLSLRDVILLEQQTHGNLGRIREKKDQLLLEQLEDFELKVTEARRTKNSNMNILEKMADFLSLELTGSPNLEPQGDGECHRAGDALQTDAWLSFGVDTSEQSNHITQGLPPVLKHSRIIEDLNRSPVCTE